MSQSRVAAATDRPDETHRVTVVDADREIQTLLDALDDADCRTILGATGDGALSASEVSEACGLPLSTAYRKLGVLVEAGLVEERTRVRRSGKHVNEYSRVVEDVVVSVAGGEGMELRVSRPGTTERPGPLAGPGGR